MPLTRRAPGEWVAQLSTSSMLPLEPASVPVPQPRLMSPAVCPTTFTREDIGLVELPRPPWKQSSFRTLVNLFVFEDGVTSRCPTPKTVLACVVQIEALSQAPAGVTSVSL